MLVLWNSHMEMQPLFNKFLHCLPFCSVFNLSAKLLTKIQSSGLRISCMFLHFWFILSQRQHQRVSFSVLWALFSMNFFSTPYFCFANSSSHPPFCILQTFKQFFIKLYALPRYLSSFFSIHEIVKSLSPCLIFKHLQVSDISLPLDAPVVSYTQLNHWQGGKKNPSALHRLLSKLKWSLNTFQMESNFSPLMVVITFSVQQHI